MITSGTIQGISLIIFKSLWETKDEAYKLLSQRLSHAIFYASEGYKENFILRHGFIRQEEFRPSVSLEDIYVNPHFIDHSGGINQAKKAIFPYEEIDYLANLNLLCDGFELSNKYSHLIVKGEQGIGKTTFLKKLGLSALMSQESSNFTKRYIPVFIQISKQIKGELDLKAMIAQEFKSCGFPEYEDFVESALKKGRLLILIDELDSVSLEKQGQILLKIKDFSDIYNMNRFIIACRTSKKTRTLSRFHEALILGFDSQKARQYIHKSLTSEVLLFGEEERVFKHLASENKSIKYIIHNPFSLSIALSLYQRNENRISGQTFLYDKILSRLIIADSSLDELTGDLNTLEDYFNARLKILAETAYVCLQSGRQKFHTMEFYRLYSSVLNKYSIRQNSSKIHHLKEEILLDFIDISDNNICQFKNPMIQKLLIAYYLIENLKVQNEVIEEYFNDSDWKDVFIFLSGMQGADYLIDSIQPQLSRYLCTKRLSSFVVLTVDLSDKVSLSRDAAVNRCYVAFMILDVVLLFGHRQNEKRLISKIMKKIRRVIDILEPDSDFLFSSSPSPDNSFKLGDRHLIDPKILRGLSLERLFDVALSLAQKTDKYGLLDTRESRILFSTINRLKKQLKSKSMSFYHRKICESNLYRLWLKALKIEDQDLNFTIDELQAMFLYYQSICLIFCCMKEEFYISGRVSTQVSEIIFNPQSLSGCHFLSSI